MNDDRVFHVRWNLQVASGLGPAPLSTARTLRTLMHRLKTPSRMRRTRLWAIRYRCQQTAVGDRE